MLGKVIEMSTVSPFILTHGMVFLIIVECWICFISGSYTSCCWWLSDVHRLQEVPVWHQSNDHWQDRNG